MHVCVCVCSCHLCTFMCAYVGEDMCECIFVCVGFCGYVCVGGCLYVCAYSCVCMCVWVCTCVSVCIVGPWPAELAAFPSLRTDGPANEALSATCLHAPLRALLPPSSPAAALWLLLPSLAPTLTFVPFWLVCGEGGVRTELTGKAGLA